MLFGIFVYEGVEPIDLATYGVLSMARRLAPQLKIITIAPDKGLVMLANGLEIVAHHGIEDSPAVDALIITGGPGWQSQKNNSRTLEFIRKSAERSLVASVCTGSIILAASGVLDGLTATTKKEVVVGQELPPIEIMRQCYPKVNTVIARLTDNGRIVTGGGVSLCIDVTLHLLSRLLGDDIAEETARILEYSTAWRANQETFGAIFEQ